MKDKKEKMIEYEEKYGMIPHDYLDRLNWLYDKLEINDTISDKILEARQAFIDSTYYKSIRLVLYEIPEFTPRPRARIVTRKGILNSVGNNSFIHIYSITGNVNHEYMKLYKKEQLPELDQLLCTPCNVDFRAYFPTPKYYTKVQIFLAEIGLDRPIIKPDFDNIEKCYSDAFNGNIWLDDILVLDVSFKKYYSVLPRMEIDLKYSNQLYNQFQYKNITKRKDFPPDTTVSYFKG